MNSDQRNFDFLDVITIISLFLQIQSLDELHSQASTDVIYSELQKQDRKYLDKLLQNQMMILEKLDKISSSLPETP